MKTTLNYDLYLQSKSFIDGVGFGSYWDKMRTYFLGDRSEEESTIPVKTSLNVIAYTINSKISKINGTPMSFNFSIFDNNKTSLDLENFDSYMLKRLDEDEFNYQTTEDGFVYGTAIAYYRWDKDDTTVDGRYVGGLAQEHIPVSQFRVANPFLSDLQKQEWVMFFKYESVGAVKALLKDEEKKRLIKPENMSIEEFYKQDNSKVNSGKVVVYTRFFRIEGEVCYQVSTQNVDITEIIPLNPNYTLPKKYQKIDEENRDRDIKDYKIDEEDMILNLVEKEENTPSKYSEVKSKFALYPFAVYTPRPIQGSFYGKSLVEGLIDNQKLINHTNDMIVLEAMNIGMGKTIVKKDALKGQVITNDPAQVITDYSLGSGFGIQRMQGTSINNSIIDFSNIVLQQTKNLNGADEISPSTASSNQWSGTAIQLITEQQNTQIEQQQRKFWSFNKKKAYVRLQFYKFYYQRIQYLYHLDDYEYQEEVSSQNKAVGAAAYLDMQDLMQKGYDKQSAYNEVASKLTNLGRPNREQVRTFDPATIQNESFDISIDVGRGSRYSAIFDADCLNNLVLNGGLANMSYHDKKLYFEANQLLTSEFKKKINVILEEEKKDEISQLQAQNQQLATQLQEAQQVIQNYESKMGVLQEYNKNLQSEFTNKINAQNEVIKQSGVQNQELVKVVNQLSSRQRGKNQQFETPESLEG